MGLLHHPSHFPLDAALLNWEALAGLPLGLLSAGMHFRQSIDHNFRSRGLSPIARLKPTRYSNCCRRCSAACAARSCRWAAKSTASCA